MTRQIRECSSSTFARSGPNPAGIRSPDGSAGSRRTVSRPNCWAHHHRRFSIQSRSFGGTGQSSDCAGRNHGLSPVDPTAPPGALLQPRPHACPRAKRSTGGPSLTRHQILYRTRSPQRRTDSRPAGLRGRDGRPYPALRTSSRAFAPGPRSGRRPRDPRAASGRTDASATAGVRQSGSGRVRGSPKRVITSVLKLVMAVMRSPAVVTTRRQ